MSTYKCENPECGNVFRSNTPLSCPKCDTLEFSTIHIKSNKKLIVIGFLILLIGAGLVYLKNDFQTNKVSNLFQIEVNGNTCERVIISADSLNMNYAVSIDRNEGYTIGKMTWNIKEIANNKIFYIKDVSTKEIIELAIPKCEIKETKLVSKKKKEKNTSENLISKIERPVEIIKSVSTDTTLAIIASHTKNEILKIGDTYEGGILFHIYEDGTGLVADLQDLGLMNSHDAIAGAANSNSGGYEDWYLPSREELELMYNTIGNGGPEGNIGGFETNRYWSSSEFNVDNAWSVKFFNGNTSNYPNFNTFRVRAIRKVKLVENVGCTEPLASNFSSLANIDDGTCIVIQGENKIIEIDDSITPNATINLKVGQKLYGGIIFYIDESGKHGLVAATEDLEGEFEWGCYGTNISGANGTAIGTGYQNTLDIVAGCLEINTASFNTLITPTQGYTDWSLPSKDELMEMYNTIGNGGTEPNIGGFQDNWYWSSSEHDSNYSWTVNFGSGGKGYGYKSYTSKVRVIRAF
jgi:hypothetical protein